MPDFGCYITVVNNSSYELRLNSQSIVDGWWVSLPATIEPSAAPVIHLSDQTGTPEGSEGYCSYTVNNAPTPTQLAMHMADPTSPFSSNQFSASTNPRVLNASYTPPPSSGHPVNVTLTLTNATFGADAAADSTDLNQYSSILPEDLIKAWKASPEDPEVHAKVNATLTELKDSDKL